MNGDEVEKVSRDAPVGRPVVNLLAHADAVIDGRGITHGQLQMPAVAGTLSGPVSQRDAFSSETEVGGVPVDGPQGLLDRIGDTQDAGALPGQLGQSDPRMPTKLRLDFDDSAGRHGSAASLVRMRS